MAESHRKQPGCSFSNVSGKNTKVTENTAEWNISYSGGRVFSSRPKKPGETVILDLNGSGHVEFGLLFIDPETVADVSSVESMSEYQYIQTTKVHRIGGKIHVISSLDGTQIISKRDHQECTTPIDVNKDTWITINILFGNVTVEIDNPTMCYHSKKGENVIQTEEMHKFYLKTSNPSCVCFIQRRLFASEQFRLHMTPVPSDGRAPSTYFVKMAVSDKDPTVLMKDLPPIFSIDDLPVTIIPSETYSLEGDIKVKICDNNIVTENKDVHQTVAKAEFDIQNGFFCLFELYRVKLILSDKSVLFKQEKSSVQTERSHVNDFDETMAKSTLSAVHMNANVQHNFKELFSVIENIEQHCEQNEEIKQDFDIVKCKLSEIRTKLNYIPSPCVPEKNEVAERIRQNFSRVLTFIDPLPLADHLFQEDIISFDNYQQVRNKWQLDPTNAKRDLLSMLIIRNVSESFVRKVLVESKQGHVYDILFSN